MTHPPWLTTIDSATDPRMGIQIRHIKSGNDGDIAIATITEAILKTKTAPFCVDIGVDVGWWSFFTADANPNGTVMSFEPNPLSYAALLPFIANDPQITLHNVAISNKDGTLPFVQSEGNSNSRDASSTLYVPCRRIEAYIGDRFIDIMKIDTEGHEIEILGSLRDTYSRIETIIFEFSSFWYTDMTKALSELLYIIHAYPYVYTLSRRGPVQLIPLTYDSLFGFMQINITQQYDILASRLEAKV